MILKPFKVEEWMTEHEKAAKYNLTDTCVASMTWDELVEITDIDLHSIVLDYGDINGSDALKDAILSLYETGNRANITTANGCLEANALVLSTLLNRGDHVITFVPGYQQFYDYPASLGCDVTKIELKEEKAWIPDIESLENAIQSHTKLIVINNPNNPTGTYFDQELLEKFVDICRSRDIWILADEVYLDLDKCCSISDIYEKGISTGSFSKLYGLAGLRLGWIKADSHLITRVNSRRDYTMVSIGPLKDSIGCAVLHHREQILDRARKIIANNKSYLEKWLLENPEYEAVLPKWGTVCFLKYKFEGKSEKLARLLLEKEGIFFVPGECFESENYFRLGLAQSETMFQNGLTKLSVWTRDRVAK